MPKAARSKSLKIVEAREAAKEAGLQYVTDDQPGITRRKSGKGFRFVSPDGKAVKDKATLSRIRSLAIPPAWTDVWICKDANGHLQATGRDDRGRKQPRYHPRWREVRDANKFEKMIDFGRSLPDIHRATRRHLKLKGLPREKVLAAVVQLLEKTLIRVGNEEYAQSNKHYGLTTIQDRHARVKGRKVQFKFTGKSGVRRELDLDDPGLAKVVKACQDLPGQDLFQYVDDDGNRRDVTSQDVNDYLKEITGEDFTAKDFRTWAGTVLAAKALQAFDAFDSKAQAKKYVVQAIEAVAQRLGNTKSVCRKCYIHPVVLETYLDGSLARTLEKQAAAELRDAGKLPPDEASVLRLLQQKFKAEAKQQPKRRSAA